MVEYSVTTEYSILCTVILNTTLKFYIQGGSKFPDPFIVTSRRERFILCKKGFQEQKEKVTDLPGPVERELSTELCLL